jgi:hypothetical protein
MLVYRVCGKEEAARQREGQLYTFPATTQVIASTHPGFHVTMVPEEWRRILNRQMKEQHLGFRYTHTLLLEIPENSIIWRNDEPIEGRELRLQDPSHVMVRGVAGPEWPLPAWVPQPIQEIDWEPTSTQWNTKVGRWKPKKEA